MNILIIDDDDEDTHLFCEAVSEVFPKADCKIVNACAKVSETLQQFTPDVIFMDGLMYPVGGKECLQILNKLVDRTKIKVIVHSGSLNPKQLDELKQVGVDDILAKAHSFQQLKSNILSIADKYNLEFN